MPNVVSLPPSLREVLYAPPDKTGLDDIAQHFVKLAGGPAAIAKLLYDEFECAEAGSPIRARIMEMMLRAFGKLEGKNGVLDDFSGMTDEDLDMLMSEHVHKISGVSNGNPRHADAAQEARRPQEEGPAAASSDPGTVPG